MTKDEIIVLVDTLLEEYFEIFPNNITLMDQVGILLFCKILDDIEEEHSVYCKAHAKANRFIFFAKDQQHLRWRNFKSLNEEVLHSLIKYEVFSFLQAFSDPSTIKSSSYKKAINGSLAFSISSNILDFIPLLRSVTFQLENPTILSALISTIDKILVSNSDWKAFFYEYILSKMSILNDIINPPKQIQRLIIELLNPQIDERIADATCRTGSFLIETLEYFDKKKKNTLPKHLCGFANGVKFNRIALMNMIMHDNHELSIKSESFVFATDSSSENLHNTNKYDVVIAHPHIFLDITLKNIIEALSDNGRCAFILSESVLFSENNRDEIIQLLNNNKIEGIISLAPSIYGEDHNKRFAIIFFSKGETSTDVLFYQLEHNNTNRLDESCAYSDVLTAWHNYKTGNLQKSNRKSKCFIVSAEEIRNQNYDLRFGRYKEPEYSPHVQHLTKFKLYLAKIVMLPVMNLIICFSDFFSKNLEKQDIETKEADTQPILLSDLVIDETDKVQSISKDKIKHFKTRDRFSLFSIITVFLALVVFAIVTATYGAISEPLTLFWPSIFLGIFFLFLKIQKLPIFSNTKFLLNKYLQKIVLILDTLGLNNEIYNNKGERVGHTFALKGAYIHNAIMVYSSGVKELYCPFYFLEEEHTKREVKILTPINNSYSVKEILQCLEGSNYSFFSNENIEIYIHHEKKIPFNLKIRGFILPFSKEIAKDAFLEMFGNPITNPKNWEVQKIGELCDIIDDVKPLERKYSILEYNKPIPYITPEEMFNNHNVLYHVFSPVPSNISKSIPSGDIISLKKKGVQGFVPKNSIVFSNSTTYYIEKLAKVNTESSKHFSSLTNPNTYSQATVCPKEPPAEYRTLLLGINDKQEIALSLGLKALAIKSNAISTKFLCYYLYYASTHLVEKMKLLNSNEKDSLTVDIEILKTFPVFLPPIELQRKFEKKVKHLENITNKMLIDLQKYKNHVQ